MIILITAVFGLIEQKFKHYCLLLIGSQAQYRVLRTSLLTNPLPAWAPRRGGSQCVMVILLTRMISVGCEFCGARIKF